MMIMRCSWEEKRGPRKIAKEKTTGGNIEGMKRAHISLCDGAEAKKSNTNE